MGTLEVLVTSMNQTGFELYESMNLHSGALIINQSNTFDEKRIEINGCMVRMLTSAERGTSIGRNSAIDNAIGDIIIFADDDQEFVTGYEKIVSDEFLSHPGVPAIKFPLISESGVSELPGVKNFCRAKLGLVMRGGVCSLAIKKNELIKSGIRFREDFGPGTAHECGEDSLFLKALIEKRMLYVSPKSISSLRESESSWFHGYTPRYYASVGYAYGALYGAFSPVFALRRALKCHALSSENSVMQIFSQICAGIKDYKKSGKVGDASQ